jgi:hypothetical protein
MNQLLILLVVLVGYSSQAFAALTVSYSGTISRSVETQAYFDIVVKISEIIPTRAEGKTNELFGRLKFFLPKETLAGGEITATSERFYVSEHSAATMEKNSLTGNYDATVNLRIHKRNASFSDLIEDKKIRVKIDYKDKEGDQEDEGETASFALQLAVANAVPEFTLAAKHKSIAISYEVADKITFTDNTESDPTGVNVFVINMNQESITLPAYRHEPTESKDPAGNFCTYTRQENGGDCISCGEAGVEGKNYYLNMSAIAEMKDQLTLFQIATSQSGKLTATGLSADDSFAVFMTYQPDGVQFSSCQVIQPDLNQTMSELLGEGDAKQTNPQCFIATAAYGSPLNQRLTEFRWFRDHYLETNPLGRMAVQVYYRVSPPIAGLIAEYPWLGGMVRGVLDPIADRIQTSRLKTKQTSQLSESR